MYSFKLKAHKYTNVALLKLEFDAPAVKTTLSNPARKQQWFLFSYYSDFSVLLPTHTAQLLE